VPEWGPTDWSHRNVTPDEHAPLEVLPPVPSTEDTNSDTFDRPPSD
jgi:hypothetical protein